MENPNQVVNLPQFAKDRIRKDDGKLKGEKNDPTREPAQSGEAAHEFHGPLLGYGMRDPDRPRGKDAMRNDGLDHIRKLMDTTEKEGDYNLFSENQMILGALRRQRAGMPLSEAQQHTIDMYVFAQQTGGRVPGTRKDTPVNPHIRAMELEEEIRERKNIARGGGRAIDNPGGVPSELHFIGNKKAHEQAIEIRKQELRRLRGEVSDQDVR